MVEHTHDYTPPQYISLLFTDLGILTPAAVSDELIRYHLVVENAFFVLTAPFRLYI